MTFGEKIKKLRKYKQLSQTELATLLGVSLRTIRGWENENRFPKQRELYGTLAEVLDCDVNYLLTEEDHILFQAYSEIHEQNSNQAKFILEQAADMFAKGDLSDEDKTAFMDEIQRLYLNSKKKL